MANRWLIVYGISLLVVYDCQSFFLRHTNSGKCITSGELVYDNPNRALPYFAVMTDNCLNVSAQFRYLDSELLHNIDKEGTLISSLERYYKKRWAVYKGVSSTAKKIQNNAEHRLKQTNTGSLRLYNKPACAGPSTTSIYLMRIWSACGKPEQKFTFGSVTNYGTTMEDVHCSPIQHMVVKRADYGVFNKNGVFNNKKSIDTNCSVLAACRVKSLCGGNRSCELTIDNNLLPSLYCSNHDSDTSKQIYTEYTCMDTYTSTAKTTANKMRLKGLPNEGFIQIAEDDSTWRYVKEEHWDKNRQKMLCRHLGFKETDANAIRFIKIGRKQDIATGNLICYNTQPSGTSCCIRLIPSKTKSNVDMPYAKCKICDKPLLQHKVTTFSPNKVFSGSGGSKLYYTATFTKFGWCAPRSHGSYLLLDLQKEYHITRVVTMGNREQTKWSESYAMKYSHAETLVNNNSPIQVTGNKNGYQASNTQLDRVYNARYVKIQSSATGNTDFCLRLELCGEVQTPAPVYNIKVTSYKYSARVTWKIPAPKDSSYITKIIVYFNGTEYQNISRGTQIDIKGLKLYTGYTVGIETEDGSSQRSNKIFKYFEINEAVEGDDSGMIGIAVGSSVAVVVIIVALVLAVIFFRRRTHKRCKNEETDLEEDCDEMKEIEDGANQEAIYLNETVDDEEKAHLPIPVTEFAHYVNELKAKENYQFTKHYDDLPKNMKTSWEVAKKPFNQQKNRYGNIVTCTV